MEKRVRNESRIDLDNSDDKKNINRDKKNMDMNDGGFLYQDA